MVLALVLLANVVCDEQSFIITLDDKVTCLILGPMAMLIGRLICMEKIKHEGGLLWEILCNTFLQKEKKL